VRYFYSLDAGLGSDNAGVKPSDTTHKWNFVTKHLGKDFESNETLKSEMKSDCNRNESQV